MPACKQSQQCDAETEGILELLALNLAQGSERKPALGDRGGGWRRRRRRENHRSWTRGAWRGRPRGRALPGTPRARPRRRLALRFCHSALGGGGGHLGSGARGAAASGESSGAPRAATSERALLRPSGRTQGNLKSAERLERNALGAEDSTSTLLGAAGSLGPSCHPPLAAATF